jgi:serine protease Do
MGLLKQLSEELEGLVAKAAPAVLGIEHGRGHGTGWVLAPDGYLVTNAHVVRGASAVRVQLSEENEERAEVVGTDPRTDVAVVRVNARDLPTLTLADKHPLKVGQLVTAIGNPFRFDRSVSLGVVSALDRSLPTPDGGMMEGLVQTDAAINPGNSGGPLVDADGAVVGINTAVVPWAQGIGFAVPARTASWVAAELMRRGEVKRPHLGIAARSEELGVEHAEYASPHQHRAIRVFRVESGSPASSAGLKRGDLLFAANGGPVSNIDDLQRVMVLTGRGEVALDVLRDGKRHALSAFIGMRQAAA